MNILVIDVGGTHVKILATGQTERRKLKSGRKLNAVRMTHGVQELAVDWSYDAVDAMLRWAADGRHAHRSSAWT